MTSSSKHVLAQIWEEKDFEAVQGTCTEAAAAGARGFGRKTAATVGAGAEEATRQMKYKAPPAAEKPSAGGERKNSEIQEGSTGDSNPGR